MAVILLVPFFASAQVSLGLPSNIAGLASQDLKVTVENIVRIIFGFLGILLVLLLLYAGFLWLTSQGNKDQIERAKKIITSAVVGLVLVLAAYGIAAFIIYSLLGATGPGGTGGTGGPPGGPCNNCIALGNGIIESHYPGVNAKNIPRNTRIVITFKEEVKSTSMIVPNIQVKNLTTGSPALIAISNDGQLTYTIVPNDLLGSPSVENKYQVVLQDILKASDGSAALPLGYQWQFTVSTASDTTAPTVISVIPLAASTVPRNTIVQINFSESIDPSGITGVSPQFTVQDSATVLTGVYSIGNQYKTAEFRTTVECGTNSCGGTVFCLPPDSALTGLAETGITDMAGNPLAVDYQWGFNTSNAIDTTPPTITHQAPLKGAAGVSTMDPAEVYFSKEMSISSLNSGNVTLSNTGFWLESSNVAGKTQVLIHHQPFQPYTSYDIAVTSGVKDINQNCFSPCSCNSTDGSCGCQVPSGICTGLSCTSGESL